MGLGAVCVDRARVVTSSMSGPRVEGSSGSTPVTGPWFKARLTLTETRGRPDPTTGARVQTKQPTLLCLPTDTAGGAVVLTIEDRLEVSSVQLGTQVYDVAGDPTPIRKKRRVIGFQVDLQLVKRGDGSS